MQRSRGELPARWLPLLGLMGGLDVARSSPSLPPATRPTRPSPRSSPRPSARSHRDPGASDPRGADIADTAPRDDSYLWRRCWTGGSLVRENFGKAELLCDETAGPANRLTAPRGDRWARCSDSRRLAWRG